MTSVDIAEFVKARLDEDDYWANIDGGQPRKQREVAAKRAILGDYLECAEAHRAGRGYPEVMRAARDAHSRDLLHLAAVWSDHPDYRQEWAP